MNGSIDSPVFCSQKGTPYRSFRTAFERAVREAGVTDFTSHDLRHTFASRLVTAGIDLPTVKALMGYKDITMTLRYIHLSSHHKRQAVKALEHFGDKVPRIFTARHLKYAGENSQVVGFETLGR